MADGRTVGGYPSVYPDTRLGKITATLLVACFQGPCRSLKDFPKRILAGDLPIGELKQVNSPHF